MMKHYALIGEKLGHSLSVPIHEAMFAHLLLDADYRLVEIPRDEHFADAVTALMQQVDGFNITIPYKQDVMPLLDRIDPKAAAIGAVNTVVCGKVRSGHNTDKAGFEQMLRYHGIDPAGQPCYVLGTGGASKAIRVALQDMGAASVTMVSRHPGVGQVGYEQLTGLPGGVLFNCTPAGMYPHPEGCPLSDDILDTVLSRSTGVADLIYNPPETRLTAAAKAHGLPACTGLYMLIAQAVEAERLWQPDTVIPADMAATLMKELKLL